MLAILVFGVWSFRLMFWVWFVSFAIWVDLCLTLLSLCCLLLPILCVASCLGLFLILVCCFCSTACISLLVYMGYALGFLGCFVLGLCVYRCVVCGLSTLYCMLLSLLFDCVYLRISLIYLLVVYNCFCLLDGLTILLVWFCFVFWVFGCVRLLCVSALLYLVDGGLLNLFVLFC